MKRVINSSSTLSSLATEGEEILKMAHLESKYLKDSSISSQWIEFRQRYERWYRACIGLMKASQFSRLEDFTNLYSNDHPDLPSIKTALLLGFSDQNYLGFRDRVENQLAILQSLKSTLSHSPNKTKFTQIPSSVYVDADRINELRSATSQGFDLSKLIELCEELNRCYANDCFLAVAMLTRAVLDHVPPIFGHKRFSEVANNYSGGGKSFKECMIHLENSSRKIADAYLHGQMRDKESLPNRTQVNFSSDLDVLLAEIVRVLMP